MIGRYTPLSIFIISSIQQRSMMNQTMILSNKNRIISGKLATAGPQTAEGFTLRFVFGGAELCKIGRRYLGIQNDTFMVLNAGTHFTSTLEDGASVFVIELDAAYLNCFFSIHPGAEDLINGEASLIPSLAETIYPFKIEIKNFIMRLKSYIEAGGDDEDQINEYLESCLAAYYQVYQDEILEKTQNLNFLHYSTRVEILRRLNLAREYLYANSSSNLSLEGIADHACLSVNHLLRTFKLAYNESPHQYLIQLRLQRAQLLLTKTEYPIYTIVNMVGFKCTSSFIRLFRTRYKTTPLKYRNVLAA